MVIEIKAKRAIKISEQIKKYLYNWIMHHPQVVQSTIANDFLKVKFDGYTEPQLVQNIYCVCLSDNFITIFLAPQNMVDSKKQ